MIIKEYAKKTFVAMINPYDSVIRTFPKIINKISEEKEAYYLGMKDIETLPISFLSQLEKLNIFLHTIDKASLSGRAIDFSLKNPITGRPMTGSSSGTAINVFLGLNDLGIGTDGGGSVLAPAASLNLFSIIHPELGKRTGYKELKKISTDGVSFIPSFGMISKKLVLLEKVIKQLLEVEDLDSTKVYVGTDIESKLIDSRDIIVQTLNMSNKYILDRHAMIENLKGLLNQYDVVISKEGPIDMEGIGDTVFGHFDEKTKRIQQNSKKGYLRVVNMISAVGLTIPSDELSVSYLLICKSDNISVSKLFKVAKEILVSPDELLQKYFGELDAYYENGI